MKKCSICEKNNRYKSYSLCRACRNKKLRDNNIKTGNVKKSHESRKNEFINQTFGKLKVIKHNGQQEFSDRKKHLFLCICECGNEAIVLGEHLKSKKTQSCGCLIKRKGK